VTFIDIVEAGVCCQFSWILLLCMSVCLSLSCVRGCACVHVMLT